MASFLELIDNTLGTDFDVPVYDPAKGRDKLIKVIDKAAEQHRDGKTPPTRTWKLGNNNAISFKAILNAKPVLLGGRETIYTPAEQFQELLKRLRAEVLAGNLDKEIKAALEGESTTSARVPGGKTNKRITLAWQRGAAR